MNIISTIKLIVFIIFILVLNSHNLFTQNIHNQKDSLFALSLEVSGGYTSEIKHDNINRNNLNFSPSMRILWKPNHLLNIGIETAIFNIRKQQTLNITNQFGTTDFRANLTAIPIICIFNMKVQTINLYGGMGISFVGSTVNAFNSEAKVHSWLNCYYLGIGYNYRLTKRFGIAIEAKAYSINKIDKIITGLVLTLNYDFFRW